MWRVQQWKCLLSAQTGEFRSSCGSPQLGPTSRYKHANTSHISSMVPSADFNVAYETPYTLRVICVYEPSYINIGFRVEI